MSFLDIFFFGIEILESYDWNQNPQNEWFKKKKKQQRYHPSTNIVKAKFLKRRNALLALNAKGQNNAIPDLEDNFNPRVGESASPWAAASQREDSLHILHKMMDET